MKKNKADSTDYKQLLQRTLADFDNYKRRVEQEKAAWTDQAKIEFLESILPVLDNLALMASHQPDELKNNSWAQGVGLVAKQIDETLMQEGIEKIVPAPGDLFNPSTQEAVSTEENTGIESGKIIRVQKPGFRINDKIIRVAQVVTSK